MSFLRRAAFALAAVVATCAAASAQDTRWAPQRFDLATRSSERILEALGNIAGAGNAGYAERIEQLTLYVSGKPFAVTLTVRGADFRFDTTIDGDVYASGRCGGIRWRRTPNGVVHRIRADTQGDDVDRWPLALFVADARYLTVAGSVSTPLRANVVAYRSATDIPHWFYIDESGDVVRDVSREGSRSVTITFDDFRTVGVTRRAFAWHISGNGGPADVTVDEVRETPVAASAVAIPEPSLSPFRLDVGASDDRATERALPASFESGKIIVAAGIDGRSARLLLDTGTSQIVLDARFARGLPHARVLRHATVDRIDVGPFVARYIAIATIPLAPQSFDGILGYDFFLGNVIHIDYPHGRVGAIPRERFVPEATMRELAAPAIEGMPIVEVGFAKLLADRFVLDTGSSDIVLLRRLLQSVPDPSSLGIGRYVGAVDEQRYLEGSIFTRRAVVRSVRLGNLTFHDVPSHVEVTDRTDSVRFPIDGILGTDVLRGFEWWFDESSGRVWFR